MWIKKMLPNSISCKHFDNFFLRFFFSFADTIRKKRHPRKQTTECKIKRKKCENKLIIIITYNLVNTIYPLLTHSWVKKKKEKRKC